MGFIGKIIQTLIGDSLRNIVTEIYEGQNRTASLVCPPGIDAAPIVGDQGVGIVIDTGGHGAVVGVYPDPLAEPGEVRIYSRDDTGAVVAHGWFKADGSGVLNYTAALDVDATAINLNGDGKPFVTHKELDDALQMYVGAVNSFFASKLDGNGAPGTITLDISAAATTTVKTGG